VLLVLVPVLLIGLAAYSWWVVRPLTDKSAGVVPPGAVGPLQVPGGGGPKGTEPAAFDAAAARTKPVPGVHASAALLVDPVTGRVLWMHRPHQQRAIASLTKLMTALLAQQRGDTSGSFRVTPAMTGIPGSGLDLHAGERVSAHDMLAATLLLSANDAATALAVRSADTTPKFVGLMNKEAHSLGLKDTHYSNPSGIYDTGNHSSAWDVAELSRRVLGVGALAGLVGSKVYTPQKGNDYINTNKLLWTYPGAVGIKTGFTSASGPSVVAAATRSGHTLIAVVLDAHGDEFTNAANLLDWGFRRVGNAPA